MYPCKKCHANNWEMNSSDPIKMRAICISCDNAISWNKTNLEYKERTAWAEDNNLNMSKLNDL